MDTHFKIDYGNKVIMFTGLIWKCALKSGDWRVRKIQKKKRGKNVG